MTAASWMDSPVIDSLASSIVKGDARERIQLRRILRMPMRWVFRFLLLVLSSDLLACSIWSPYRPLSGGYVEPLSYGASNRSKGKNKTHHNIGDSVDWQSKQVTTRQFADPLSHEWLFTFDTCSILFRCMSLIISTQLAPSVIHYFHCHFACILSILTLGPYSSYERRSSFTRLFHFHVPYFAVSGCMTYIISPCPLYLFRA